MSAGLKQFKGSRLKVQRANRHIQELNAIFETFLKSDFCEIRIEKDPSSGNEVLKLVSIAALPESVALVMGDAVHNLRSALDYMTGQILGSDNDRVTFPLSKERDKLVTTGSMGEVRKAVPKLADFILSNIETHDTGKPSLWAAGRLDNIDKHKLLIPTVNVQAIPNVGFINEKYNIVGSGNTFIVTEGAILNAISMPGPIKITGYGKPTAQILFAKGQPLEGLPVIKSLLEISQLVAQTISTVETFWFGK